MGWKDPIGPQLSIMLFPKPSAWGLDLVSYLKQPKPQNGQRRNYTRWKCINDSQPLEENHWYKVGTNTEGNKETNSSGKTKARGDQTKKRRTLRIHRRYENWGRIGFLRAQGMKNSVSAWGWHLGALLNKSLFLSLSTSNLLASLVSYTFTVHSESNHFSPPPLLSP